ncbi:Ankyrin [Parvibaculum lavamentivorans DS-1]|uniref:Ankyrin n=1 Tax=Parvibaculum lavamentivorans (strain DS-1 / DSM 13023 / NCIMB 13966) TaxID=402881 RepID=A7HP05_PARL1|nr:ankyrin repeat domain-containing protein [Parvibaculum lavamentivorans]ABS61638.1 Ankyrin [Parvibaculum lavamentivorans DS-1]
MTRVLPAFLLSASLLLAALFAAAPVQAMQPGGPTNYIIDNETVQAARTGDNEKLRAALVKGVSPNESGRDGIPMLILAVGNGHLSTVKMLLENGADPDRRAPDGTTPLSLAALAGRTKIAEALLEAGANPNRPGANREVPLLIATRARHSAIVEVLIRHDVDIYDTDVTGRTALDLAEENHFGEIAALLRGAGA